MTDLDKNSDSERDTYYSTIYLDEGLPNKNPRTRANTHYLPVIVTCHEDPVAYQALFTEAEVNKAIARAAKNREDFEDVRYLPYDPEEVTQQVICVIEEITVWELFKIWCMRHLGTPTTTAIRRVLNEQENNENS